MKMDLQVVNALLTQLDKLRHKKNVLVVSTSNLAKAIGQRESRVQLLVLARAQFPLRFGLR